MENRLGAGLGVWKSRPKRTLGEARAVAGEWFAGRSGLLSLWLSGSHRVRRNKNGPLSEGRLRCGPPVTQACASSTQIEGASACPCLYRRRTLAAIGILPPGEGLPRPAWLSLRTVATVATVAAVTAALEMGRLFTLYGVGQDSELRSGLCLARLGPGLGPELGLGLGAWSAGPLGP